MGFLARFLGFPSPNTGVTGVAFGVIQITAKTCSKPKNNNKNAAQFRLVKLELIEFRSQHTQVCRNDGFSGECPHIFVRQMHPRTLKTERNRTIETQGTGQHTEVYEFETVRVCPKSSSFYRCWFCLQFSQTDVVRRRGCFSTKDQSNLHPPCFFIAVVGLLLKVWFFEYHLR